MSDLCVQIEGAGLRLTRDRTWYLLLAGGRLSLTPAAGRPGQLGFFIRLLSGWYFRTEDPASVGISLAGRPVQARSTYLEVDSLEVALLVRTGNGLLHREPQHSGFDEGAVARALRSACPDYGDLERLLAVDLGVELYDIAPRGDMRWVVDRVIRTARTFDWLTELLTAIRFAKPEDPVLDEVVPRFDRESIVDEVNGLFDPRVFATELIRNCARVCRIKVLQPARVTYGTGFLVGPDLVLTNHHVLADALIGRGPPTEVTFAFDFHSQADRSINHTAPYGLAPDWRVADSPPSAADFQFGPMALPEPSVEELDYALVRLNGSPGTDELENGERRDWLHLLDEITAPDPGARLVIPQHPKGLPIKAAIGEIIAANRNATRLTHRVNTMGGSSGSPCFTLDFGLVALHHAGSPDFTVMRNEAVPISTVIQHLTSRGIDLDLLAAI